MSRFVSIDIAPTLVPELRLHGSMAFLPRHSFLDIESLVRSLLAAESALEAEEAAVQIVAATHGSGLLSADVFRDDDGRGHAVDRACEFLASRLQTGPTLEQISAAVGVNKFVLMRYFRRSLGTTPHAYLVMLRLNRARGVLARGATAVEAAQEAGFSDQAHLGRWFRRVHGITPAAFGCEVSAVGQLTRGQRAR